jgi:hypothetical protein
LLCPRAVMGLAGHPRQAVMPVRLSRPANLRRMAGPRRCSVPGCDAAASPQAEQPLRTKVCIGRTQQSRCSICAVAPNQKPHRVFIGMRPWTWAGVPGVTWRASG